MSDIIIISDHAREKMIERGVEEVEVHTTIEHGEQFAAKRGRIGFRRNFTYLGLWDGKHYSAKQVEVVAVKEENAYIVVTVIAKYF